MHALDIDQKTGTVISGVGTVRQALNIYFQNNWGVLIYLYQCNKLTEVYAGKDWCR